MHAFFARRDAITFTSVIALFAGAAITYGVLVTRRTSEKSEKLTRYLPFALVAIAALISVFHLLFGILGEGSVPSLVEIL